MYNFYCRYVHFSDSALISSAQIRQEDILSIEFSKDFSKFEKYILENAKSFSELNKFILLLLKKSGKKFQMAKK